MQKVKMILNRLLHPPKCILLIISPAVFAALIFIFAAEKTESVFAYLVYGMSAYSLAVVTAAAPSLTRNIKSAVSKSRIMKKVKSTHIGGKYFSDLAFRGSISIYQGMTVSFFYVIFRLVTGILYASAWFISIAVYYLVLGGLRAYLIFSYRHRNNEIRCYRRTAWMLFLLNIPMGGMIILMIKTNSGFTYPGYIIYLSAMYTFYTFIISIINLVKFRRLGNQILSAARVLNFVSAMMSVLGLQTAMISRFSADGENYRKLMTTITGGFVYAIVIVTAVYMLMHSRKIRKQVKPSEQV